MQMTVNFVEDNITFKLLRFKDTTTDKIISAGVAIYIGDDLVVASDTMQDALKQFDKYLLNKVM